MKAKQETPWVKQLRKLPKWINTSQLSMAAGFEKRRISAVQKGRHVMDGKEAKRIIKELRKLESIIAYQQGELY